MDERRNRNNSIMKYIAYILSLIVFSQSITPIYAQELSDFEKLQKIVHENREAKPCHQYKVRYNQSYPAAVVASKIYEETNVFGFKESIITPLTLSEHYSSAEFKGIQHQRYKPGEKSYFVPAFYANEESKFEGEFVGYLAFRVAHVKELYDEKKHGDWDIRVIPDKVPGITRLNPITVTKVVTNRRGGRPNLRKKYVVYEICYEPSAYLAYDTTQGQLMREHPEFPFDTFTKNSKTYLYDENDTPTFWGYYRHISDEFTDDLNTLDARINALVFVRDLSFGVIPGVGTSISAYNCYKSSEPSCWAGVGLDAASDVATIFKAGAFINLAGKLGKRFDKGAETAALMEKLDRFSGKTLYITAYANMSLGAIYLQKGEFLEGLTRLGAGGIDIFATHITPKGITGVEVGKTPDELPDDVPEIKTNTLEITDIESDSVQLHATSTGLINEIIEPHWSIYEDELIDMYARSRITHPGYFQRPRVQIVRRVDSRDLEQIKAMHGLWGREEADRAKSLFEQIESAKQNLVSTTYKPDVHHLINKKAFLPDDPVNLQTKEEIEFFLLDIASGSGKTVDEVKRQASSMGIYIQPDGSLELGSLRIPWDPEVRVPDSLTFRTYEYEAEVMGVKANEIATGEEFEVITRGIRPDEIIRVRQIDVTRKFIITEPDEYGKYYITLQHPSFSIQDGNFVEHPWIEKVRDIYFED